jgi:hypothetical protein
LTAYYEALQLDDDHPSAAFVLYVTVIEGIGAGQVELTQCLACGAQKGAAKRFRTALRTIMTGTQAATLAKAYERRSRTAHVGALHGAERTLGYLPDSDFRIDDTLRFEEDELATIRQAARAVLIHTLSGTATR